MMTPEENRAFAELLCANYTDAEFDAVDDRAHHAYIVAVAKELRIFTDQIGRYFDPEVITAALEIVLNDWAQLEEPYPAVGDEDAD